MRIETGLLRTFPGRRRISVVNPMVSPVVEETQSPGSLFVAVLQRKRSHASRDSLVAVEQRCTDRPRIGSIEMRHVHVASHVPMVGHFVSQLGIATILFKAHVGPMSVGTVIRTGYHARKPSLAGHGWSVPFPRYYTNRNPHADGCSPRLPAFSASRC